MKLKLEWFRLMLLVSASAVFVFCAEAPVCAAIPPTGEVSSKPNVNQLFSRALTAFKAGKLPLATILLKTASSADPKNGRVRATLGQVLAEAGEYSAAERELRQARRDGAPDQFVLPSLFQAMIALRNEDSLLSEFPEPDKPSDLTPDILKARAVAFLDLNQPNDALNAIDKSLKLRRDAAALFVRARIAQVKESPAAALKFANEAIALAPDRADLLVFKTSLLLDANDLTGALTLADKAVSKFPSDRSVQFSRVDVLMRLKRYDQAKAVVDAALSQESGLLIGIYYRAILLASSGDNKNAWRIAQSLPREFLTSQPRIAVVVSRMAGAAGVPETSASVLAEAIQSFPKNPELRLELATIRLQQKDVHNAVEAITPVSDTLDPAIGQQVAAIYMRSGRPDLALEVFERLADADKGNDATTLQLVALETQQGHPDQALNYLSSAVAQKPTDAVLASRLAAEWITRGRFADALAVADNLGRDSTYRVISLLLRGEVFLAQKKFADALNSYTKAVQANPKSQEALYGRANVLEQLKRFGDAANDLGAILRLNPGSTAAYLKLAEIRIRQNQDEQVRSVLSQAIKQIPNDPVLQLTLAKYLVSRSDQAGALRVLDSLLKFNPNNTDGLALRGEIQLAMGRNSDAVATYKHLVALTPNDAESKSRLSTALVASGDRAGAGAALKSAASLAPHSADVQLARINLLLAAKDIEGAIAAAQAYQKSNPGTEGDLLLGDTLAHAGRLGQALAVYKKSFSATPTSVTVMRIAQYSIAGGDTESAVKALTGWLERNPGDNNVRLGYATLLMQRGNNEEAIPQFREVLKTDPNNVDGLNDLAWLIGDRDPGGAIGLATKAKSLAPNSSDVLDTLGWLEFKHAKAADSVPLLKRAHELNPQDGEISYHLALSLDGTGKHDSAKEVLKALLASQVKFTDLEEARRLANAWN